MEAMSIQFVCEKCGKPITNLPEGCLWISYAAALEAHRASEQEREKRKRKAGRKGDTVRFSEIKVVTQVKWHITHDECISDPTHAADYWISLDRIDTAPRMLHWTAHLMRKTWITLTDWDSLMFKFAEQLGGD